MSTVPADAAEIAALRADLARERAERERLQQDLEIRNAALDVADSHFLILDARAAGYPILLANRALARDYGCRPEDLLGQPAERLAGSVPDPDVSARLFGELTAGRPVRAEIPITREDGSIFWIGIAMAPVRDIFGCITHFLGVGANITLRREEERKKRELQERLLSEMRERERIANELRLAQKLESVGRLASGIAHELNTPMQYVNDSVHFLRTGWTDLHGVLEAYRDVATATATDGATGSGAALLARAREKERSADLEFLSIEIPKAFDRTLDGVHRVTSIVRAMKEFAHPHRNEQGPADLNHALETTFTVARSEYKYLATLETSFGEIPVVVCNVGELNQVFLNLIINAVHAIQDAGRDVASGRIVVTTALAPDGMVEIAIADNGCGIPQENLERIFDPFFTTKEVGRGTGQGLPIAHSIVVEKHRGRILVESKVGEGTRIVIRLPVAGGNP